MSRQGVPVLQRKMRPPGDPCSQYRRFLSAWAKVPLSYGTALRLGTFPNLIGGCRFRIVLTRPKSHTSISANMRYTSRQDSRYPRKPSRLSSGRPAIPSRASSGKRNPAISFTSLPVMARLIPSSRATVFFRSASAWPGSFRRASAASP